MRTCCVRGELDLTVQRRKTERTMKSKFREKYYFCFWAKDKSQTSVHFNHFNSGPKRWTETSSCVLTTVQIKTSFNIFFSAFLDHWSSSSLQLIAIKPHPTGLLSSCTKVKIKHKINLNDSRCVLRLLCSTDETQHVFSTERTCTSSTTFERQDQPKQRLPLRR